MRLSPMDASFLYAESVSGPMHISSIYVLEGALSPARVREHFDSTANCCGAFITLNPIAQDF